MLDARRKLLEHLSVDDARDAIDSGIAAGGMIPKLEAAMIAAAASCETRIINGTISGALGSALARSAIGTLVTA